MFRSASCFPIVACLAVNDGMTATALKRHWGRALAVTPR